LNAFVFVSSCTYFSKIPNDTLVIGIENEIKSLDIRFANDANSVHLTRFLFQSLVEIGEDLTLEPDLALSFESLDNKTFKFLIPTDRTFHDGTALTVEDVLYSLEQARTNPKIKSSFDEVDRFEIRPPNEFLIHLKRPRFSFVSSELPNIKVFPKHLAMNPSQNVHPIGSGPFQFVKKSYRDIVLKPFSNYFNGKHFVYKNRPRYETLILRSIEDPTTRFLSILGGDIDVLFNSLPYRKVNELRENPNLQVFRGPGTQYQYLGLQLRNNKFKDKRIREALNIAINRKKIIEYKLKGFASPATGPLPLSNPFYDESLPEIPFDPERAKSLLKNAKIEQKSIELKCSSDQDVVGIMKIIAQNWKEIGLDVRIVPQEFASFFSDVQKTNFEVFSLRWTAVTEPDVLRKIFHSKEIPPGRNRVFYENSNVDKWLELASVESDFTKRKSLYSKIQHQISQDIPYIALWYPDNLVVTQKSLKNFRLHPSGNWMSLINTYKLDSTDVTP
jgi:peptide/nickel transport system substrate-binding protein